ncbi:MAG: YceH family protein [Motiliproteus sp.]|nr:YceH family protein [Motiliproteus sp.]MCW9052042.1 YceH family protein [Motiliproteus sp.]
METGLSLNQLRVIGCLIEKEITTPDQYPLSLNALTAACNQKSNREPVLDLEEICVQEILDELKKLHLVREESSFSSRVAKYKHRFCNTEFSELKFSDHELAIICVLFLRGPQTPGELRLRCGRLSEFDDIETVERTLADLMERHEGGLDAGLVRRLEREPGKRECRYAHCFGSDEVEAVFESANAPTSTVTAAVSTPAKDIDGTQERLAALEAEVLELRQQMATLKSEFDELLN